MRESVWFLAPAGFDELMGERGTSALDGLWMPVPKRAKRQLGRLEMIHLRT